MLQPLSPLGFTAGFEYKKVDDDDADDEELDADDGDQADGLGYSVAKEPAYPQTPILSLITDFGATDFLPHLQSFLCASPFTSHSALNILPSHAVPAHSTTLPLARESELDAELEHPLDGMFVTVKYTSS
jgi:hypothetical protein